MNTRDIALLQEAQQAHLNALTGVFGRNLVMDAGVAMPARSARRLGRRSVQTRRPAPRPVSENPVFIKFEEKTGEAEVEIEEA